MNNLDYILQYIYEKQMTVDYPKWDEFVKSQINKEKEKRLFYDFLDCFHRFLIFPTEKGQNDLAISIELLMDNVKTELGRKPQKETK